MSTNAPTLAERYGKKRPSRRGPVVVLALVVALVGGGWLLWTAWFHGSPAVSSQLLRWEVVDSTTVRITFDVAIGDDEVATCRARALAANHEAVGDMVLQVPTDAGDADGGQITTEFRTISQATSVELVGCTTPSQNRPR